MNEKMLEAESLFQVQQEPVLNSLLTASQAATLKRMGEKPSTSNPS